MKERLRQHHFARGRLSLFLVLVLALTLWAPPRVNATTAIPEMIPEPEMTMTEVRGASADGFEPMANNPEGWEDSSSTLAYGPNAAELGSISGFLWVDGNGDLPTDWNGLYDGDEYPLEDYTVSIYASDDLSRALVEVQTGVDGMYLFADLELGSYVLGVDFDKVGDIDYLPPVSMTVENRFAIDWTSKPLMAYTTEIEISVGQHIVNINAGMRLPMGVAPMEIITSDSSNLTKFLTGPIKVDDFELLKGIYYEDWVVVKRYPDKDYPDAVMITRKMGSQYGRFDQNSTKYEGSELQKFFTGYYEGWGSPLKGLALVPDIGGSNSGGIDAVSIPVYPFVTASSTTQTKDIVFAMSRQDMVTWNKGTTPIRNNVAKNWPQGGSSAHIWSRTAGTGAHVWELINYAGSAGWIADAAMHTSNTANRVPALWIQVGDIQRTVTVHYIDTDGKTIDPPASKPYQVPYYNSIELQGNDIPTIPGYEFTWTWKHGSEGTVSDASPIKVTKIMKDTDIYLIYEKAVSPIEKHAYIGGSPTALDGTAASPITVRLEEEIRYTITTTNEINGGMGTLIADKVPFGLVDIRDISHGGVYNALNRTIIWNLSTKDEGEITVEFTATVGKIPEVFENTASVVFSNDPLVTVESNATYHQTLTVSVTEYFRELGNEDNILDGSLDSNVVNLEGGDPYIPAAGIPPETITKNDIVYAYYGYRINGGEINTTEHEALPSELISAVYSSTTITYIYTQQPTKNAYIEESTTAQNGTKATPETVKVGDEIKYTISTVNSKGKGMVDAKYDVLFVLNWSNTMKSTMIDGSIDYDKNAMYYEREVMLFMSDYVVSNYLDSRVAIISLNSSLFNTNNSANTNIQNQTKFYNSSEYWEDRNDLQYKTLNTDSALAGVANDNSIFLQAAIDKIAGLSTKYGSSVIIPRDLNVGDIEERIPVIVFFSDFQNNEAHGPGNHYWTGLMKAQADRFSSLYSNSVLHTVRLDHKSNSSYNSNVHDDLMTNNVSPAGRENWAFTKVSLNTPLTTAKENILDALLEKLPTQIAGGTGMGTIITDVVPEGLEVDENSISHPGVYAPDIRAIIWDLTDEDEGEITVSFNVTVAQKGMAFENKALVTFRDGILVETNTTYHKSKQITIPPTGVDDGVRIWKTLPFFAMAGILAGWLVIKVKKKRTWNQSYK